MLQSIFCKPCQVSVNQSKDLGEINLLDDEHRANDYFYNLKKCRFLSKQYDNIIKNACYNFPELATRSSTKPNSF